MRTCNIHIEVLHEEELTGVEANHENQFYLDEVTSDLLSALGLDPDYRQNGQFAVWDNENSTLKVTAVPAKEE